MTKRIRVDGVEMYPVYLVSDDRFGLEIEATEEQVDRWARAAVEFERAQDEMGKLYNAAADVERERQAREKAEREEREREEREAERARQREEQAKREAGWQRLRKAGDYAYDAEGNVIGVLKPGTSSMARPVEIWPTTADPSA